MLDRFRRSASLAKSSTGSILRIASVLSRRATRGTGRTGLTGSILLVLSVLSILFILSQKALIAAAPAAAPPSFAEPSLSPDGREIAFVSGGDVWTVSAGGGEARLLVSHPATESRPLWSPDGTRLAFVSTRTGNGDIYVLTLATGELARLTYDDALDQLDAWSADGRWLYFSSAARDIAGMEDVYRVSAAGGTPMPVSADRYANEYWSAPSPDGQTIAITARGVVDRQWWRNGHSHLDESEIWLVRPAVDGGRAAPTYEALTHGGAKDAWPMWGGADGRTIYFVSDRGGAQNVWSMPATSGGGAQPVQLTRFTSGRVLWPSISADRRAIVFERDFRIWRLDLAGSASTEAREVPIALRGAAAAPGVEHVTLTSNLRDLALSPDGRKIAFVARGEIFAASAKDGGDATRVTHTAAQELQPAWAPDSRRLAYVSARDGASRLYLYDFATRAERALGSGAAAAGNDEMPRWSPDGARLAYVRDGRELRVLDVATGADRAVAPVVLDRPPLGDARQYAWSPDGRWLAVLTASGRAFTNVSVVAATGGEARPVTFTANANANSVSWSPDGTYLLFDSGQRTEAGQLLRVDLVPHTPRFREDQFRDLFNEQSPKPSQPGRDTARAAARTDSARGDSGAATGAARGPAGRRPVTIDFADVRRRLTTLPLGIDVQWQAISPDGKLALVVAGAAGQTNLYTYSLDELAKEDPVARQLTSTPGPKSDAWFSPDGKEVFYLDAGRVNVVSLDTRTPRPLAVAAELDVDFAAEKGAVFDEGWRLMRDNFFDEHFNGVDWDAERRIYGAQIAGARTPDEMRRLMSLMVGDLNASHLGVGAPPSGPPVTGRLGLRFDRVEYERAGRLRVTEVIPLSPAAVGGVKVGDELLAVDGQTLGARTNLDALLERTIGRRVALSVRGEGGAARDVAVRPVSLAVEKGLLYRAWVESRRAYVAKASNGRLGYVHMIDMSSQSLSQLFSDLDAENQAREGVIVDVRNNNGGFVNAYALDVLARRPYLTMTQRGRPTAPARAVLGQRALELPTVLVTNQHSLSDAEDFTEGYRALGLGRVVGEPTAGWIIFTWNSALLDGTTFRLPRARIRAADGSDMEMHPRPVDVTVVRPIGESYSGRDSQLDAAVAELLGKVGKAAAQH